MRSQAAAASHRGGTLKLLCQGGGRLARSAGQLHARVLAALPGDVRRPPRLQEGAAATAAFTVVPDLAANLPTPTNGGKTWVFKLRKGIKFSNGKPVTVNDVVASFQRIFKVKSPTAGELLRRDRRRARVPQDARHLHAEGRRGRQREGEHGHDQPDRAGLGVQVQARRPAREHRPGGHARRRTWARSRFPARARTTSRRTTRTSSS